MDFEAIKEKAKQEPIMTVAQRLGIGEFKKAGGGKYKCRCPFHDEKTPSFTISEIRNIYKCYGCGVGGDTISLVMRKEGKDYKKALEWFEKEFTYTFTDNKKKTGAKYTKLQKTGKWSYKKKTKLTPFECQTLGPLVTNQIANDLNYYSLEYYQTPEGHRFESTDEYPIYLIDEGDFQKVYQPLNPDKSFRFIIIDQKGQRDIEHIYGFKNLLKQLELKKLQEEEKQREDDPETEPNTDNVKLSHVIIASGGSDALNLASIGEVPVWFNSEADILTHAQYEKLKKYAHLVYNLPDIDQSGLRYANILSLKHMDINTIYLPPEVRQGYDNRGYKRKDFKDFIKMKIRDRKETEKEEDYQNSIAVAVEKFKKYFDTIRNGSYNLIFWESFRDRRGRTSYEIDNTSLYAFLQANGYYRYANEFEKDGYVWVHIENNIINQINPAEITEFVNNWLKNNWKSPKLRNAIYRSNQTKEASLGQLEKIEVDTKLADRECQYVIFQPENQSSIISWRVSKYGIEEENILNQNKYVWADKVQKCYVKKSNPLVSVMYSDDYELIMEDISNAENENIKNEAKEQLKSLRDIDKYKLEIHDEHFSFIKYLWNTSNFYWQKEAKGEELTEDERKKTELHFINKMFAIGYLLHNHRELNKPWAVYAMDGENVDIGIHQGGTGKTIFLKSITMLLKHIIVDGQEREIEGNKHLFEHVTKDTDYIIINDLHKDTDFHSFLNKIEGNFIANPKHKASVIIEYQDAPKMAFTSNNAIRNVDNSILRRLIYVVFSNYYHSKGGQFTTEWNPHMEFGKSIPFDYNQHEMIKMYNFFANCLQVYLQFHNEKIDPPQENIVQRNLKQKVGDMFIDWADDFFFEHLDEETGKYKINDDVFHTRSIFKNQLYEQFKIDVKLNDHSKFTQNRYTDKGFKNKLQIYCEYRGILMNPEDVEGYERSRKRIREYNPNSKKKEEIFFFRWNDQHTNMDEDEQETVSKSAGKQTDINFNDNDDAPF